MPRIARAEILLVDLPFRRPFKHAAAVRQTSGSLFLRCLLDTGDIGFGECLPREYVTGETREETAALLAESILPRLVGREFVAWEEVLDFLDRCDGAAPADWVPPDRPHPAAWCAVDLLLLDAFGRAFGRTPAAPRNPPPALRYSPVFSSDCGALLLLLARLCRFPQAKLKVGRRDPVGAVRRARRLLGAGCAIRVDANMDWTVEEALAFVPELAALGVESFEQPVAAADLDGLATIVARTGRIVMADESFHDKASLERLLALRACTAVNVRISKCGGFVAARNRCRQALAAGLAVQLGCQVGESSLLSAAQFLLLSEVPQARWVEGAFGLLLLRDDPFHPLVEFHLGGRPPRAPAGPGLGVSPCMQRLGRFSRHGPEIATGEKK